MNFPRSIFRSTFAAFIVAVMYYNAPAYAVVSYFDMDETRSENIAPFPKWTGMVSRFTKQRRVPDSDCGRTQFHPCSIIEWKAFLVTLRDKSFQDQLDSVNTWANEHPYIEDQVNWGMSDYWETPYEFMDIAGDCEDYAIAKYYSMKNLGIPVERLRIIILQDLNLGGIIHAVLGVYDGDELYILDNQSQQVKRALSIYHYRPIFGINENAWWAYHPRSG